VDISQAKDESDALAVMPEEVPVTMPELPLRLVIDTLQQFKAVNDPVRSRRLGLPVPCAPCLTCSSACPLAPSSIAGTVSAR
jgi:hypothetical protein